MHDIDKKVLNSEIGKINNPMRKLKILGWLVNLFFVLVVASFIAIFIFSTVADLPLVLLCIATCFGCFFMWVKCAKWHRLAQQKFISTTRSVIDALMDPFYDPEQ